MTLKKLRKRWPGWWFTVRYDPELPIGARWTADAVFHGDGRAPEMPNRGLALFGTRAKAIAALGAWMDANIKRATPRGKEKT